VASAVRTFISTSGVPRLIGSGFVGRMPIAMIQLALFLVVEDHTGSVALAGLVTGANGLGSAVLSPAQGALVDRFGQFRVLAITGVGNGACIVAVAVAAEWGAPAYALVGLSTLAGALIPPLSACSRALWHSMLAEGQVRNVAFKVDVTAMESAFLAGPLLVGALAAVVSPAAALITTGCLATAGTLWFAGAPASRRGTGRREGGTPFALRNPLLRRVLAAQAWHNAGWGAVLTVGLPAMAVSRGTSASAGLLVASCGAGMVGGGLLSSMRNAHDLSHAHLQRMLVFQAVLLVPLIGASSVPAGAALGFLGGLGAVPVAAAVGAMSGKLAYRGAATQSFSWNMSAAYLGQAAGALAGGVLASAFGYQAALAVGAASALAGATFVRWPRSRTPDSGMPGDEVVQRPSGLPGHPLDVVCDDSGVA
jgi:predicted MFS family arabinose efflux permease